MESAVVVGIVYLAIGVLWSRIYYVRRHRIGWGVDVSAAVIGLVWPLTVFTSWNPALCNHRDHVLERADFRESYEAENRRLAEARRVEGR